MSIQCLYGARQRFYQNPQRSGFSSKARDLVSWRRVLSLSLAMARLDQDSLRAQAPSGRTITDPEERELIQYCGISSSNNKVPYDPFIRGNIWGS